MENHTEEKQNNIIAVLAYFTFIGWIVALILHSNNRTSLGAFHLRQMLGIMLLPLVLIVTYPLIYIPWFWMLFYAFIIAIILFWILGLISAIMKTQKPVPLTGRKFQKLFATIIT